MISSSQIRAARALLGWSGEQLAQHCGISLKTLRRYEQQDGVPEGTVKILSALQATLEAEGVEFTGDPLKCPGVILHKNNDS